MSIVNRQLSFFPAPFETFFIILHQNSLNPLSMITRPHFFPAIILWMMVILTGIREIGRAAPTTPDKSLHSIESVIVAGSPISDHLGNVVGITIPLKRAGRLFLLEATIDQQSGNCILDTGASGLVLNKTYFRESIVFDDMEGGGVTGTTGQVSRVKVKHMQVSDFSFDNVLADVTQLGHLENRRGVKILGLFGMAMLKNFQMVIDLHNSELQLFRLDKNGNSLDPNAAVVKFDMIQKIDEFHNVMFVKATIGGKILDFCLDTGAESNVVSIDSPKKVMNTITITRRSGLIGVGSARGDVLYGILNDFTMGNRQIHAMETILCSLADMSQQYAYPIDGMLGYDFFSRGKIYLNIVKKEMGICLKTEETP